MSHTLQSSTPVSQFFLIQLTIANYALGGESVAASEINIQSPSIAAIDLLTVPASQNSLGVTLIPALVSGKIMLFRFNAGVLSEIPATSNLNATVKGLVYIN